MSTFKATVESIRESINHEDRPTVTAGTATLTKLVVGIADLIEQLRERDRRIAKARRLVAKMPGSEFRLDALAALAAAPRKKR